ncbi:MAG: hypothetical protein WAU36_16745 [Cyclobacteriaceae bacterium]
MKKIAWMMTAGLIMTASFGFSQGQKREGGKEDVPRDVHMSNMMKKHLELTDEQYEKVLEMNKGFELERAEAKSKREAFRKERADQLKQILTEEQWKKWEERERKPGKGGKSGKRGPGNEER